MELRRGVRKMPAANTASPDTVRAMALDMFVDYLGVRLNGPAANGKKLSINMDFTDTKEKYALTLDNSVLNYSGNRQAKDADCTVTLTRGELNDIILGRSKLPQLITAGTVKIAGNEKALQELLGLLDSFDIWFDVITANPPPRAGK